MGGKGNEIQGSENITYKNGKEVGGELGEMNRDPLMKVLCSLVDPMSQFTLE